MSNVEKINDDRFLFKDIVPEEAPPTGANKDLLRIINSKETLSSIAKEAYKKVVSGQDRGNRNDKKHP